ncbi:hypothetical protein [Taibaiella soli]|uniref:Uncharacterized protein n=1 Tax=Taibaiella soli TaxID=1649169 RepID=A0A2W2BIE5_9BACT|nr:hypothetical protein [Taibaiella soli]PZF73276.1 hypothetical protein DN068_08885 [Taibaiella soli]
MMTVTQKLHLFLADEDNFLIRLRFLEGLDEHNLNEFMGLLNEAERNLSGRIFIEKKLASMLIEVVPMLLSISESYTGKERKAIDQAVKDISEKITAIFYCEE